MKEANMNKEITGKVIVVGDNIDTDQIYPGRFLAITDQWLLDNDSSIPQLCN